MLHLDAQRRDPPAVWPYVRDPLVKRMGVQTFGIGTAVALRAKAFGCRVVFFDPNLPNGAELGLGIGRARTLEQLLSETDTLSVHAPLTPERRDGVFVLEIDLDTLNRWIDERVAQDPTDWGAKPAERAIIARLH